MRMLRKTGGLDELGSAPLRRSPVRTTYNSSYHAIKAIVCYYATSGLSLFPKLGAATAETIFYKFEFLPSKDKLAHVTMRQPDTCLSSPELGSERDRGSRP